MNTLEILASIDSAEQAEECRSQLEFGYQSLVLGAWGCGAFGNDPVRCAAEFRYAFENKFRRAFSNVVFAITDCSPERRFFGPLRDVFSN